MSIYQWFGKNFPFFQREFNSLEENKRTLHQAIEEVRYQTTYPEEYIIPACERIKEKTFLILDLERIPVGINCIRD